MCRTGGRARSFRSVRSGESKVASLRSLSTRPSASPAGRPVFVNVVENRPYPWAPVGRVANASVTKTATVSSRRDRNRRDASLDRLGPSSRPNALLFEERARRSLFLSETPSRTPTPHPPVKTFRDIIIFRNRRRVRTATKFREGRPSFVIMIVVNLYGAY